MTRKSDEFHRTGTSAEAPAQAAKAVVAANAPIAAAPPTEGDAGNEGETGETGKAGAAEVPDRIGATSGTAPASAAQGPLPSPHADLEAFKRTVVLPKDDTRAWPERAAGHFRTITRHKMEVTRLCIACGLVKQGLAHDLSKYAPVEFATGVRYYQGTCSPNAAERLDRGFSEAWLHHKGRNRHHFEYWLDVPGRNGAIFTAAPMPTRYVVEMFCDRVAASKIYQGDAYTDASALVYFRTRDLSPIMHPDTQALLESLLKMLADRGEAYTLQWIRRYIVKPRAAFGEQGRF